MVEKKEVAPVILDKVKNIVLFPVTFAREVHHLCSAWDKMGRESWGVKKTIVAELAIMAPPHLFLLSLVTGNGLLFLGSGILTLAEPAAILLTRVDRPELFKAILELNPKSSPEIWRKQLSKKIN